MRPSLPVVLTHSHAPRPSIRIRDGPRIRALHNAPAKRPTILNPTTTSQPSSNTPHRPFHTTAPLLSSTPEDSQSHYEALSLSPSASPQEIKRQFFTLSKLHHPDKNPDDPDASKRFVRLSEAYHVLSSPEKRSKYDAELAQKTGSKWGGTWRGSYSSAQQHHAGYSWGGGEYGEGNGAGGKPATGLNKKRGTFRGPPPSFYKAGGYGDMSSKRSSYQNYTYTQHTQQTQGGGGGGMGAGMGEAGNEVPHFDDKGHRRRNESVHEQILKSHSRRHPHHHSHSHHHGHGHGKGNNEFDAFDAAAREEKARKARTAEDIPFKGDHIGAITRFVLVSGAVGVIGITAWAFGERQGRGIVTPSTIHASYGSGAGSANPKKNGS